MIALSVISGKSKNPTEDTEIAAKLTETGYFMYKRNPLFLSPEVADLASPTLS